MSKRRVERLRDAWIAYMQDDEHMDEVVAAIADLMNRYGVEDRDEWIDQSDPPTEED